MREEMKAEDVSRRWEQKMRAKDERTFHYKMPQSYEHRNIFVVNFNMSNKTLRVYTDETQQV